MRVSTSWLQIHPDKTDALWVAAFCKQPYIKRNRAIWPFSFLLLCLVTIAPCIEVAFTKNLAWPPALLSQPPMQIPEVTVSDSQRPSMVVLAFVCTRPYPASSVNVTAKCWWELQPLSFPVSYTSVLQFWQEQKYKKGTWPWLHMPYYNIWRTWQTLNHEAKLKHGKYLCCVV
jgi:hypothetical protein